ncbi:helix-turn-helix domain-containing protein [Marinoscillum pacificum]|uniref:helix-turn-helix domain-containing protein n=1 Tax=Marinoscillum pacificum TaxID=392723 RepID=UPI0021573781|nr:helix-turn-helix domain-containing protein [Marinoscillum pacificum]
MENPFQELYERLDRIEGLLVSVRDHKASEPEGEEDRLLNVREAARFLGDAVATLYGRTSKNEIPFYKRGKKVYFKKSELLAWIEQGRVKSQKEIQEETALRLNQ